MRHIVIVLFLVLLFPVKPSCQDINISNKTTTRAVVIGISDYQDPDIPDLQFANKDAIAFANFLRSEVGGSLSDEELILLVDEDATAGKVAAALYQLIEETKENDKVIIYFSGHGDVELKFRGQPGFLLCWDAPPRVYMAGGVLQIGMLQTVVSTLSLDNKANVTLITDACRSGKLAGSKINGSQLTNLNLQQQFANEIKILSCQPNEYSIEGEQWGGGRGAFSYHLLDGLYGMADSNADNIISLRELGRYLEDKVSSEVAPESQWPMTIGNGTESLASVNSEILTQVKADKSGQLQTMSFVDSKGLEESVLEELSPEIQGYYYKFKSSLENGKFLSPEEECADYYFNKLIVESDLAALHGNMRRNYAAALQDDAQQTLNKWLKIDMEENQLSLVQKRNKYAHFPDYLGKAIELLGPNHYMYSVLHARKLLFEGFLKSYISNRNVVRDKFLKALELESELPHIYYELSKLYALNGQVDSAEYYTEKSITLAPTWVMPYARMAYYKSVKSKEYDHAENYLKRAEKIDPESVIIQYYFGRLFQERKEPELAKVAFKRAIGMDSMYRRAYIGLGNIYADEGDLDNAEANFKMAIAIDPTSAIAYTNLGIIYLYENNYEQALKFSKKAIEVDPTYINAYYNMTCIYSLEDKIDDAFRELENALINGGRNYKWLNRDSDLNNIRNESERWNDLMLKYFPNLHGKTKIK